MQKSMEIDARIDELLANLKPIRFASAINTLSNSVLFFDATLDILLTSTIQSIEPLSRIILSFF